MNKKFFGVLLACVLVLSQAVIAFAAPSGTTIATGSGSTTVTAQDKYEGVSDAADVNIILVANDSNSTDAQIVSMVNATGDVKIESANFVTQFYNVEVAEKSADGLYHATLDVPALPANASTANVRGLHYSVERQTWEVLTPVSVNGTTVEFALIDCSPIAVYVTDAATSPATGVASNWTLFMGAAVVLFAVSAIASKKTR